MTFDLTLVINHPKWKEPVTHTNQLHGSSKTTALKSLSLTAKHICELKNYGETSWQDANEVTHTLTLSEQK